MRETNELLNSLAEYEAQVEKYETQVEKYEKGIVIKFQDEAGMNDILKILDKIDYAEASIKAGSYVLWLHIATETKMQDNEEDGS